MKKIITILITIVLLIACTATLDDADTNRDGIVTPKEQKDAGISINVNNNNNIIILDDRKALDNISIFNANSSLSSSASEATATAIDNKTDNKTDNRTVILSV